MFLFTCSSPHPYPSLPIQSISILPSPISSINLEPLYDENDYQRQPSQSTHEEFMFLPFFSPHVFSHHCWKCHLSFVMSPCTVDAHGSAVAGGAVAVLASSVALALSASVSASALAASLPARMSICCLINAMSCFMAAHCMLPCSAP